MDMVTSLEARALQPVVRAMRTAAARIDGKRRIAFQLDGWADRIDAQIQRVLREDREGPDR